MGNAASKKLLLEAKRQAANKQVVKSFYEQVICSKCTEPIDQYINSTNYIEHHPFMTDGSGALKKSFKSWFSNMDEFFHEILLIAADGDLVFVHVKCMNSGQNVSSVDIFRVTDGRICEHWDVVQAVPEEVQSSHPMF